MKSAARFAESTLDWFPDWRGQACAIIASGPSAKKVDVASLRGRIRTIAIKECAIDLAPWADVVYGCDAAWWKHRRGLPDFKGLKLTFARDVRASFPDVIAIEVRLNPNARMPEEKYINMILTDTPGVVGAGHNSGFQALHLAVQFGVNRILLVGFDMQGEHYYGRNNWFQAGNPDQFQFDRCIRVFKSNAGVLKDLGVDVVNGSPSSALHCFRRSTIPQTLREWNL